TGAAATNAAVAARSDGGFTIVAEHFGLWGSQDIFTRTYSATSSATDTILNTAGNDLLDGGAGNDIYNFARGSGRDVIADNDGTPGNSDLLSCGATIASSQLWFRHVSNDLEVSIIGTSDKVTIQDWYSGSAHHVEQFKTADNKVLLDTRVENLVQAMASFSPPAAGQTTLPQTYQNTLAPVIAANWQS
ncbi:MAG: calcium-binding protein, partial [Actinomycetota bacterium]